MFDPEVYRDMCRELRAPQEKIEEMIAMTENNKKKFHKPLRTALALCATVAMMVVGVAAANAALITQLQLLAEMERPTVENVL